MEESGKEEEVSEGWEEDREEGEVWLEEKEDPEDPEVWWEKKEEMLLGEEEEVGAVVGPLVCESGRREYPRERR